MTQFNLDLINKWPTFGWPLSSTSIAALSVYAVGGFDPKLALDFIGNTYRTGGADSTLANSVTHARAGHATMVDSDGLLKWAPHNLLPYSEDFSNASWVKQSGTTVTANQATSPASTTTADLVVGNGTSGIFIKSTTNAAGVAETFTRTVWIKSVTGTPTVTIKDPVFTTGVVSCNLTTDWQSFVLTEETTSNSLYKCGLWIDDIPSSGIYIWGAHAYRSDLGGMVNNPSQPTGLETYVPTTSSPVYLPRVGHHVYNGSAWVNEGVLHESEARTNLLTSSGDVAGGGWVGAMTKGAVTAGSPFGTYQTISPVSNGGVGAAIIYQLGKTLTSGATYVTSALVKYSAGSGWLILRPYDTGLGGTRAWFDLQNGVVGTKDADVLDYGMIDYGDGWWLCWASDNVSSTSGGFIVEVPNSNGGFSTSTADVILIAGTQYEQGSTPSSYIPTSGSAVTRAAETLTVPAANLPYSSTNVSIQIDGKMTYADTDVLEEVMPYRWRHSSYNYVISYIKTSGSRTGQPIFQQRQSTSGLHQASGGNSTYSPNVNVPFNLSGRYGSTFINGAHEGTLLTANTTPTALPDLSSSTLNLGYDFMGTIGKFRMWDEDLGDTGIATASSPSTEPSLQLTFDGSSTSSFTVLDWSE